MTKRHELAGKKIDKWTALEYRNIVVIGKNDYYMQLAKGVYVAIKKKPQLLRRLFLRAFFGFKIVSHNTIFGGEE